jgi:hypothetical protein
MSEEQQELWLRAAVDALDGIRAEEVKAVSAELKRSVSRHNQIVPEIAKLVDQKRQRANQSTKPQSPYAAEMAIRNRSDEMRAAAKGEKRKLSDAYEWERQARIEAGLHVEPYPKPLTRHELDTMPSHIRQLGINSGFLEYRGDMLVESAPTGGR